MSKLISILGAGESGVGAALLAKAKGFKAFVSDKGEIAEKYKNILLDNQIEFEEGKHTEDIILTSSEVIKSPGIPDKLELIKKIHQQGIPVISEIEFAARYSRAKFIGITGSNGKTTTTLLTYHLLKKLGLNVGLAGNIGDSLAKQVVEDNFDYFVLELSSFQLDGVYDFHPHIAVILNITPDHLDRYDYEFQNYVNAKFRITQNLNPQDCFIYWDGDEGVCQEIENRNLSCRLLNVSLSDLDAPAYSNRESIILENSGLPQIISIDELPLVGKHNEINTMCAFLVGQALGLNSQYFVEAIKDFTNAQHRLEFVKEIDGVKYINDSKATNVDSVFYALDSMKGSVVLIAGGVDKGNDYSQIDLLVAEKVKAIVAMGVDNSKLTLAFGDKVKIIETNSLHDAMQAAHAIAVAGDVVLLSPACASFDLFKNYEDRGAQFKTWVNNFTAKQ